MRESQSVLKTALLDLLHALHDDDVPLILGGGYGLYLKQVHLLGRPEATTLIPVELWPAPRATEDLDILLPTEVIVDTGRLRPIRAALDQQGYAPVRGAEYMQFVKPLSRGRFVKIDVLTGPLEQFEQDPRVKVDERRVRPRRSVGLQAHRTDEALAFQINTMMIAIDGLLSTGDAYQATVQVPSAFTLLLVKLHAFRDRCADSSKDLARHHALDLYRIINMMDEPEFSWTRRMISELRARPALAAAARVVAQDFATPDSLGSLRLRSHALWHDEMAIQEFLSALQELFLGPDDRHPS